MRMIERNTWQRIVPCLWLAVALSTTACEQPRPAPPVESPQTLIERGKYLVAITACNECHTPLEWGPNGPQPDMSRMLSGHPETLEMPPPPDLHDSPWMWAGSGTSTAFVGPWGISYAVNLTPDSTTGIGIWTFETFSQALRTGKHTGVARPILPPMPWQAYSNLTDDDMRAMYAYLKSIPPVRNLVPDAIVAEPPAGQ